MQEMMGQIGFFWWRIPKDYKVRGGRYDEA